MRRQLLVNLAFLALFCAGCGPDQAEQRQPADGGEPAATPSAPDSAPGAEATPAASDATPTPSDATPAASDADADTDAVVYTMDPAASEVFWTVGPAGMMARLGHSHVISAEQFSGTVAVDPEDPSASRFELEIPVAELVVDDPELRSRLGEEFDSEPSGDDIAGTRRNMLSPDLLQGDTYSHIRVRGGAPRDGMVPVEIDIAGETVQLRLPGDVEVHDDYVEARGEFDLEHADLGLSPFSALGGALQVTSTIEFYYRIRAERAE